MFQSEKNTNEKQKSEILQNDLLKKFEENLQTCKADADELHQMHLNNGSDYIYNYCYKLRNEVHLAIEYRIEEIHKIGDYMLEKINKFEIERINYIERNKEIVKNSDVIVNELNEFYSKWSVYLSNIQIDESLLKKTNKLFVDLKKVVEREKTEKGNQILNNNVCVFDKNTEILGSDLIGNLLLFEGHKETNNTNDECQEASNDSQTLADDGKLDPVLKQELLDDRFYNNDSFKNGPPVNGTDAENDVATKIQASFKGEESRQGQNGEANTGEYNEGIRNVKRKTHLPSDVHTLICLLLLYFFNLSVNLIVIGLKKKAAPLSFEF